MSMPGYSDDTVRLVDIFAKQIELQGQLGIISARLEAIPDHEQRIRALEKWRYGLPLATVMSAGSLALAAYGWLHH